MWRFEMTRNLTLAMDEEKLARLRVYAAQNRTTVNALIRKQVDELLDGDDRRRKAREWMVAQARKNMENDTKTSANDEGAEESWRWSREDTYTGPRFDWPRTR
jgi:hypothetical protein